MHNPILISCFAGCGKTYLSLHQSSYKLRIADCDSGRFTADRQGWPDRYLNEILLECSRSDVVLISQHSEILFALRNLGFNFVMVVPDNRPEVSARERGLIKQQWFGRFVLRDNAHIHDVPAWFERMKEKYEEWTDPGYLCQYDPLGILYLKENEYLEDVFWRICSMCEDAYRREEHSFEE